MMRLRFILAVGLGAMLMGAAFSVATAAEAQPTVPQQVSGTVDDALSRPVADVQVTLQDAAGKSIGETVTDSEGHFRFNGVAPGTYAVIANKTDFEPATADITMTAKGANRSSSPCRRSKSSWSR